MKAEYIVLDIGGRMSGDYTERVCNTFSKKFRKMIATGDFQNGPNNCARFGTKDEFFTTIDIYLYKTKSSNEGSLTLVELSRYIEEPLEESEEIILGVRKELSSLLLNEGLMIH